MNNPYQNEHLNAQVKKNMFGMRFFIIMELLGILFPNVHIYIAGIISYDFLFEFIENVLLSPFIFKFLSFFRKSLAIKTIKDAIDND